MIQKHKIQTLRVLYEEAARKHFVSLTFGTARSKEKSAFGNLCAKLMPETEHALAFWHTHGYMPVSTQDAVADAGLRLGTRVDVVCRNREGKIVIVEMKWSVHIRTHTHTPTHTRS